MVEGGAAVAVSAIMQQSSHLSTLRLIGMGWENVQSPKTGFYPLIIRIVRDIEDLVEVAFLP